MGGVAGLAVCVLQVISEIYAQIMRNLMRSTYCSQLVALIYFVLITLPSAASDNMFAVYTL